jgi:hypothetical protein
MNIVMVNGEKQCGKSTFCGVVQHLLSESETTAIAFKYSLVTPLEVMLHDLWRRSPNYREHVVHTTEELKRMRIFGRLGRDWMIAMGNAWREMNENVLIELMFGQVRFIKNLDPKNHARATLLIENWGFPGELFYARYLLDPSDRLITVHLNERASRRYNDGEQFDSDNRFSLGHLAQLVNPTPSYVASLIDPDGGHPSHNQPIVVETGSNWTPPPV